MEKQKILLVWGYHRHAWVEIFEKLTDDFDFTYLFYSFPEQEKESFTNCTKIYWSHYRSAQHLLEEVQPRKVVFMSAEAPITMALNWLCKKRGIETITLQHGLFHNLKFYIKLQEDQRETDAKNQMFLSDEAALIKNKIFKHQLLFLLLTTRLVAFGIYKYILKQKNLERRYTNAEALSLNKSKFRITDKYIVYSKGTSIIYIERDGIDKNNLIQIGNPEFQSFVNYASLNQIQEKAYFLLIDQPLSEIKDFNSSGYGISKKQTNEFYLKLNSFALLHNCRLKIKLHPYSYESDFFINHPNIDYIKDTEVKGLVMNSKGIFGFFSSLIIPAIYYKKVVLFEIWKESDFIHFLRKSNLVSIKNYFNFELQENIFQEINKNPNDLENFIKHFTASIDADSTKLLKKELDEST